METPRETSHYTEIQEGETRVSRVSWAAVFGGTLIMLITLMLLSLLGIGIGIGSINPLEEAQPLQGIGTGALIWWVISNLLAVFAGAFTAAKLTNLSYKYSGVLHGILSWSLYTLISFIIMTSTVGAIISGVGGAVSKSISAVGKGVSEISGLADHVDTDRIKRSIQEALTQPEGMGSGSGGQEFEIDLLAVVREVFIEDGQLSTNVEREEVEEAIARHSSLSERDAERAAEVVIREYEQMKPQLQQLKLRAQETGQQVAETVSRAAIWAFVALLLGVIMAAFAGHLGKPTVYETTRTRTIKT
jgi:hypothetical protein